MTRQIAWFCTDAWRALADLYRDADPFGSESAPESVADLPELQATEWDPVFERYMRNRLIMGVFRYGRLGAPGKPRWDRIAAAVHKLADYRRTGNAENLVDVANYMLLEYVEGDGTWAPTDDGRHCSV